jgi:hypothetical protein
MADLVREMSGEMAGESDTGRRCVGLYDLEDIKSKYKVAHKVVLRTFLKTSNVATHLAFPPQMIWSLSCKPNARTAGWISLPAPAMPVLFSLG